jgi:mono/diheme cytochrome c family protein
MGHQLADALSKLKTAAGDENGRVRLAAIVAASWLPEADAKAVFAIAEQHDLDRWMAPALAMSQEFLEDAPAVEEKKEEKVDTHLKGADRDAYVMGKEIYQREGFCATCHQENGKGLETSGFPPLAGTKWAIGNEERLIKIALNGLYGPIEVQGKKYPGQVPMTAYGRMLKDNEIAAVLTYVRNSFGNKASVIKPETVKKVREATADKKGFYTPEELLKDHPLEK